MAQNKQDRKNSFYGKIKEYARKARDAENEAADCRKKGNTEEAQFWDAMAREWWREVEWKKQGLKESIYNNDDIDKKLADEWKKCLKDFTDNNDGVKDKAAAENIIKIMGRRKKHHETEAQKHAQGSKEHDYHSERAKGIDRIVDDFIKWRKSPPKPLGESARTPDGIRDRIKKYIKHAKECEHDATEYEKQGKHDLAKMYRDEAERHWQNAKEWNGDLYNIKEATRRGVDDQPPHLDGLDQEFADTVKRVVGHIKGEIKPDADPKAFCDELEKAIIINRKWMKEHQLEADRHPEGSEKRRQHINAVKHGQSNHDFFTQKHKEMKKLTEAAGGDPASEAEEEHLNSEWQKAFQDYAEAYALNGKESADAKKKHLENLIPITRRLLKHHQGELEKYPPDHPEHIRHKRTLDNTEHAMRHIITSRNRMNELSYDKKKSLKVIKDKIATQSWNHRKAGDEYNYPGSHQDQRVLGRLSDEFKDYMRRYKGALHDAEEAKAKGAKNAPILDAEAKSWLRKAKQIQDDYEDMFDTMEMEQDDYEEGEDRRRHGLDESTKKYTFPGHDEFQKELDHAYDDLKKHIRKTKEADNEWERLEKQGHPDADWAGEKADNAHGKVNRVKNWIKQLEYGRDHEQREHDGVHDLDEGKKEDDFDHYKDIIRKLKRLRLARSRLNPEDPNYERKAESADEDIADLENYRHYVERQIKNVKEAVEKGPWKKDRNGKDISRDNWETRVPKKYTYTGADYDHGRVKDFYDYIKDAMRDLRDSQNRAKDARDRGDEKEAQKWDQKAADSLTDVELYKKKIKTRLNDMDDNQDRHKRTYKDIKESLSESKKYTYNGADNEQHYIKKLYDYIKDTIRNIKDCEHEITKAIETGDDSLEKDLVREKRNLINDLDDYKRELIRRQQEMDSTQDWHDKVHHSKKLNEAKKYTYPGAPYAQHQLGSIYDQYKNHVRKIKHLEHMTSTGKTPDGHTLEPKVIEVIKDQLKHYHSQKKSMEDALEHHIADMDYHQDCHDDKRDIDDLDEAYKPNHEIEDDLYKHFWDLSDKVHEKIDFHRGGKVDYGMKDDANDVLDAIKAAQKLRKWHQSEQDRINNPHDDDYKAHGYKKDARERDVEILKKYYNGRIGKVNESTDDDDNDPIKKDWDKALEAYAKHLCGTDMRSRGEPITKASIKKHLQNIENLLNINRRRIGNKNKDTDQEYLVGSHKEYSEKLKNMKEDTDGTERNVTPFSSRPKEPPPIIMFKRRAIRQFPNGKRVALYYSDRVDMYISIPYNVDNFSFTKEVPLVREGKEQARGLIESFNEDQTEMEVSLTEGYETNKHFDHDNLKDKEREWNDHIDNRPSSDDPKYPSWIDGHLKNSFALYNLHKNMLKHGLNLEHHKQQMLLHQEIIKNFQKGKINEARDGGKRRYFSSLRKDMMKGMGRDASLESYEKELKKGYEEHKTKAAEAEAKGDRKTADEHHAQKDAIWKEIQDVVGKKFGKLKEDLTEAAKPKAKKKQPAKKTATKAKKKKKKVKVGIQPLSNLTKIGQISREKSNGVLTFADGSKVRIDAITAKAIHTLHSRINDENKIKLEKALNKSRAGYEKTAAFAHGVHSQLGEGGPNAKAKANKPLSTPKKT